MGFKAKPRSPCHFSPIEGKMEMFCHLHDFVPPAFGLPASSMSIQDRHVTDPSSQAVVSPKPTHWCLLHHNDRAKVECRSSSPWIKDGLRILCYSPLESGLV